MSKFWAAYASVNDDVRHKLVEEAWFGRRTTGDIDHKDMPALAPVPEEREPVNNFYGDSARAETAAGDLYGGPVPTAPAPASDVGSFYGNGPATVPDIPPQTPSGGREGPELGY